MSKLAQNYPQLRIAIYGLVAAALLAAGVFGYVTEDQAAQILSMVTSILGTLGLVLAAMNVKNPGPAPAPVEYQVTPAPVDVGELAAQITQRWDMGVQSAQQALADGGETVADARRRVEQALGEFQGR
ncbi:hypothetical protein [Rhodococcoides fascians]|uniref:hypothetical protein n=1 Tax=Rhodococcoides fascians TaxID=1828 RepID=UPI000689C961|nr:hypothetical protein [Rhodococcus fascians]